MSRRSPIPAGIPCNKQVHHTTEKELQLMARTQKPNAFLFGKRWGGKGSEKSKLVDVVAFEIFNTSWLDDDEVLGRDPLSLDRDLYVATGFNSRRQYREV